MKKMVLVVYNESMDEEVTETLGLASLEGYTKALAAHGKGRHSGTHMDSDIWPGKNNILYIACELPQAQRIMAGVKELRQRLGSEGIKAFLLPLEDLT